MKIKNSDTVLLENLEITSETKENDLPNYAKIKKIIVPYCERTEWDIDYGDGSE